MNRYLALIGAFPLRPLRSDEELGHAISMIDSLIVRGDLDWGEQDYLDVLAQLVERYEDREHPMPAVSDADLLRHLIEVRGVTPPIVAQETGIADSTISELVAGQRALTRPLLDTLARYFGVSPKVFSAAGPLREPGGPMLRRDDDAPAGVAD